MKIRLEKIKLNILNMHTRMPFKYGIAELTVVPHLFLSAYVAVGGKQVRGIASEGLLPKWFTKNPDTSYKQEILEMIDVVKHAAAAGIELGDCESVFDFWYQVYSDQKAWGQKENIPGLLSGLGVSLLERAVIDGYCRAVETPFLEALRSNAFQIELGRIHKQLQGHSPDKLLCLSPTAEIKVRHTVGLVDPLRTSDISIPETVNDGLPQSLEACIAAYGLRMFKIKIWGHVQKDVQRLTAIGDICRKANIETFGFTLDGNEHFDNAEKFIAYWDEISRCQELSEFFQHLLFVEQPIDRKNALSPDTAELFSNWRTKPLLVIDESDSDISSVRTALACGYNGTTHKNCKGVFKGIANACLLNHLKTQDTGATYILSCEDLSNVGPVALLQDLLVANILGIEHLERNGHHYFKGLSMYSQAVQAAVLKAHNDLYRMHDGGFAVLDIQNGKVRLDSLTKFPFGYGLALEPNEFTAEEAWEYASLFE